MPGRSSVTRFRRFLAAHLRHHHVGDEQIDRLWVRGQQLDRLGAGAGRAHRVAGLAQHAHGECPHCGIVLDHQDGLGAAARDSSGRRRGRRLGRVGGAGEADREGGALAGRAVDVDVSTALVHGAVHGRETEPGALPDRLGGEERLEHMGQHIGRHAVPGIAHPQHHGIAVTRRPLAARGGEIGGLDGERAALRHRVARVHRQVHQHLLDLRRIGLDPPQAGGEPAHQLDVLVDQARQQALHLRDHLVEIDDLRSC
jgi:hypothetical protein